MKATITELHDRATRGLRLSLEEQVELEALYQQQDEEEHLLLGTREAVQTNKSLLYEQIDAALIQLATVTQRIQELTHENEYLRNEVGDLKLMLVRRMEMQPA